MRQSMYLRLAMILMGFEARREQKICQKAQRRVRYIGQPLSAHLLRDIGFEVDGFTAAVPNTKFKLLRHLGRMKHKHHLKKMT